MPLYDYSCPDCGPVTAWAKMSQAAEAAPCPLCKKLAARCITAPFASTGLTQHQRSAIARNERSASEPRLGQKPQHHHPHPSENKSCTDQREAAHKHPSRPWMIGH